VYVFVLCVYCVFVCVCECAFYTSRLSLCAFDFYVPGVRVYVCVFVCVCVCIRCMCVCVYVCVCLHMRIHV